VEAITTEWTGTESAEQRLTWPFHVESQNFIPCVRFHQAFFFSFIGTK